MNLKSRENIAKILGLNESVFKIGDIYKVKPIIDVPKSLINSFVSKAKKEQDVDPREMWSDMDIAELMVNYIMTTYLTADNISVEAIMGEKKPGETVTVAEPQVEAPIEPVKTEVPTPEVVVPQTQEETKIASIPATLQVESVINESQKDNNIIADIAEIDNLVKNEQISDLEGGKKIAEILKKYFTNDERFLTIISALNVVKDYEDLEDLIVEIETILIKSNENLETFMLNQAEYEKFATLLDELAEAGESAENIHLDELAKLSPKLALFAREVKNGNINLFDIKEEINDLVDNLDIEDVKKAIEYLIANRGPKTEKLETFMLNTELTDTLKEHLKENKISFEKVSGILELKCTKEQLSEIKNLF